MQGLVEPLPIALCVAVVAGITWGSAAYHAADRVYGQRAAIHSTASPQKTAAWRGIPLAVASASHASTRASARSRGAPEPVSRFRTTARRAR